MIVYIARSIVRLNRRIKRSMYTRMAKYQVKKYGKGLKVNGKSRLSSNTILGHNVNFNGIKILGKGEVRIGDNFHSGIECMIISESHNYDNGTAIPYDNSYILYTINIEDNVWLGNRVIIAGNITIGEGAIIQTGSVVVGDIPKYGIAGGHPAKVFKERDIAHYERLKAEGKFH